LEQKEELKAEIDVLKLTLRPRISETHTGASINLRRVTSLELI
jgi:hypothetical protein